MERAMTTITCHDNAVPDFLEAELDKLYGNVYSSLAHFRIYGGLDNASSYVARNGCDVSAIFLFRIQGNRVRVINEGMQLTPADIARFVDYIFSAHKSVTVISFHAIEVNLQSLRLPYQQHHCTDDSVIDLPATSAAYLASLGVATRKKIRNYLSRLRRDFPNFQLHFHTQDEIEESDARNIIRLNHRRMESKNKVSAISEPEAERMLQMARTCGFLAAGRIDGRLCCGALGYRFGDNYFSMVNAHDPAYDYYRLGLLINYLAVCEAIARDGKQYHLMWGREPQKALLQGMQRDLDQVHIFRSRMHAARNAGLILKTAFHASLRRMKLWTLQEAKPTDRVPARIKTTALNFLRKLKRMKVRRA